MPNTQPPKRLRSIVKAAQAAGWQYDTTKHGHPRLTPPRGATGPTGAPLAPVTFAKTPSDHRGDLNGIAALRRAGIDIPRK